MNLLRWCWLALFLAASGLPALAAEDKIIKVLPQYVDLKGRNSLSPSLYDRDAYQARLRSHPEQRSGMQFKVQWKARTTAPLKMRLEVRGTKSGESTAAVVELPVRHKSGFSKWADLPLLGQDYVNVGEINSWRVTLWDGEKLLAEQKSFLW